MADSEAKLGQILAGYGIPIDQAALLVRFWSLVCAENLVQNLTRITEVEAFAEEHVRDSWELIRADWLQGKIVDLGTGGGFPGIPCAIMNPALTWVLIDSERSKIDFVNRAVSDLGLKNVQGIHGRAEDILKFGRYDFVVSRALGPVTRIFGWIARCSTWNNLILLKGPRWDEEWATFQQGGSRKHLALKEETRYEVGPESKKRKIVWLTRI